MRRNDETEDLTGEVVGHFYKFMGGTVKEDRWGDETHQKPKIFAGILVEVEEGRDRIPINDNEAMIKLPMGTSRDKVPKKYRLEALQAVRKKYPPTTQVSVQRRKYTDERGIKRRRCVLI